MTSRDRMTWIALSMVVGNIGTNLIAAGIAHSTRNLPYTIGASLTIAAVVMFIRGVL